MFWNQVLRRIFKQAEEKAFEKKISSYAPGDRLVLITLFVVTKFFTLLTRETCTLVLGRFRKM